RECCRHERGPAPFKLFRCVLIPILGKLIIYANAVQRLPLVAINVHHINTVPSQSNIDWRENVPSIRRRCSYRLAILKGGGRESTERCSVAAQWWRSGRKDSVELDDCFLR